MTVHKAIDRITWRLNNGWKANENDARAINTIIEFINDKHKEQLVNYGLFAKLYIYFYGSLLNHYKATVFSSIPQKELHKILYKPLEDHIEHFKNTLNDSELYIAYSDLDISLKHPKLLTEEERQRDAKKLEENKDKIAGAIANAWDYESVKEHLDTMINKAIDTYKNK